VIERTWTSELLAPSADGTYRAAVDAPERGYMAFFVEATFSGQLAPPLKLTSGVVVVPDTYPHDPFVPAAPRGTTAAH
jgi:PhoPQ-activated pathogenicity-related protein